ncbi:hypothetical protein RI367_008810 [Sorochytrium milnesiophthora]
MGVQCKAWMTQDLFAKWLRDFDGTLKLRIMLLTDQPKVHQVGDEVLSGLRWIPLRFFPPTSRHTCTHSIKALFPLSSVVIASLLSSGTPTPSTLKIRELDVVKLVVGAWSDITSITIANCWHRSGILPDRMSVDFLLSGSGRGDNQQEYDDAHEVVATALLALGSSPDDLNDELRDAVNGVNQHRHGELLLSIPGEEEVDEVTPRDDWFRDTLAAREEDEKDGTDTDEPSRPTCQLPSVDDANGALETVLAPAQRPGMLTAGRLEEARTLKKVFEQLKDALQ